MHRWSYAFVVDRRTTNSDDEDAMTMMMLKIMHKMLTVLL